MKSRFLLILLAGVCFGVGLGFLVLISGNDTVKPPATGSHLQDFTLKDLNNNEIKLSGLRGKPVLINFWATWCVPCKSEMPLLEQYYLKLKDKIAFYGIDQQETTNVIMPYLKENGITFPTLLDETGEVTRKYFIQGFPTTYFVDGDGILRAIQIGPLTVAQINTNLNALGIQP
ncbi:MAG TPA: redoxin domain-containing protein [Anaerolineaceae bacterium]|nr:redoxin domain-containing protein [Anaerolineaceae bacterium]